MYSVQDRNWYPDSKCSVASSGHSHSLAKSASGVLWDLHEFCLDFAHQWRVLLYRLLNLSLSAICMLIAILMDHRLVAHSGHGGVSASICIAKAVLLPSSMFLCLLAVTLKTYWIWLLLSMSLLCCCSRFIWQDLWPLLQYCYWFLWVLYRPFPKIHRVCLHLCMGVEPYALLFFLVQIFKSRLLFYHTHVQMMTGMKYALIASILFAPFNLVLRTCLTRFSFYLLQLDFTSACIYS